jgi:tRNA threonylcarbamoyladenosine biosynthesis protein TsaE
MTMTGPMNALTLYLNDETATLALGETLARALVPGLTIALHGDLGAGKTTLVRGLLRALGHAGPVKSPSYALLESYRFNQFVFNHFDLYRFRDPDEWHESGFEECFGPDTVCAIEWPEKAAGVLPVADLDITLEPAADGRRAHLAPGSPAGTGCLARLSVTLPRSLAGSPPAPAGGSAKA